MFDPDRFISWMADQGSGTLRALIRDASWASGCESRPVTQWLSRIEALGAVTIDWHGGQWNTNPCEITDLPGNTQTAVLTGARPANLDFYREHGAAAMPQQPEESQLPLPATVWLQYTEHTRLHEFAAAVSATVIPCAAELSARSLSPFTPGPATAPPARDSVAEWLDPLTGRFRSADLTRGRPVPGLYRYTLFGRQDRYALLLEPPRQAAPGHQRTFAPPAEQTWHNVDRRAGIHHVLRPSAFPLRWKADQSTGHLRRSALGRLTVDRRAPLPLPQERTAVLCTGLASLRTADAEHYDGVPFHIADRIARTLHRSLETA
ncbi:hypothetical protein [Streptomyces sp. NPDC000405]|uniref:hypothetical protein n=1 Tax=Streptomyces sp. NPDC000405 TaxID=3161033 RepID=UPI00398CB6E8